MTKTDVANMALVFIGKDMINDITEKSSFAKKCALLYPVSCRDVLAQHEWQSAIAYTTLDTESVDTNNRNDQYEYIFDLPSDCVRLLDVELDDTTPRYVEGTYIYSNYSEIDVRYIKDISDEVGGEIIYDDLLAQAIAMKLATMLAPSLNPEMIALTMGAYAQALKHAMNYDAIEAREVYDGSDLWTETT